MTTACLCVLHQRQTGTRTNGTLSCRWLKPSTATGKRLCHRCVVICHSSTTCDWQHCRRTVYHLL